MACVIANWKANISISEAENFCNKMNNNGDVIICPPVPYLAYLSKKFSYINFASQDVLDRADGYGAYTGDIPAKMLKDLEVKFAIVGHSERRIGNCEDDFKVNQKAINCRKHDITPIVCIGEDKESRADLSYVDRIISQIKSSLRGLDRAIIAYEPIWSIGTGVTPSNKEINEMIDIIKSNATDIVKSYIIVYGGSVNSKNAETLLEIEGLGGVLVGGGSLNYEELMCIANFWDRRC
jgi:triosephosphate isomerase